MSRTHQRFVSTPVPSKFSLRCAGVDPFQITRKQLFACFNEPRTVRRMITAGWIQTIRQGKPGREALYDFQSAKQAYERLLAGEQPPLLPSEQRTGRAS